MLQRGANLPEFDCDQSSLPRLVLTKSIGSAYPEFMLPRERVAAGGIIYNAHIAAAVLECGYRASEAAVSLRCHASM